MISRAAALINPRAGSVSAFGATRVAELLQAALPPGSEIVIPEPAELDATLLRLFDSKPDALVVAGGDGTQRAAATLAAERGIPLAPLPGGTLNVLPKKAFGARNLEGAIDSLRDAAPRKLEAARADGKLFLVAACVGPIVRISALREAVRGASFTKRLWQQMRYVAARAFSHHFAYHTLERGWTDAHALVVALEDVDSAFGRAPSGPNPNHGPLEAAAVTFRGWGDFTRFSASALAGGWRSFQSASTWDTARTELDGRGRPLPAMLDGESVILSSRAVIEHDPKGVPIWAPPMETPTSA